jgi:hypothetical protein
MAKRSRDILCEIEQAALNDSTPAHLGSDHRDRGHRGSGGDSAGAPCRGLSATLGGE